MLALARSEGQSIIIDGHIEVKVVKWSRSSVRLAIQAPREVRVDRDETWRKMHPGQMTPLEMAEKDRNERFAKAGLEAGQQGIWAAEDGVFHAAEGLAAGSVIAAEGLLGAVVDKTGKRNELRAARREVVVKIAVADGQTVTSGQLLLILRAE